MSYSIHDSRNQPGTRARIAGLALTLILAAVAFVAPAAARADELVQNGGFEAGDFTGWTLTGDTSGSGVNGENPYSGQFAAYFQTSESVRLSQTLSGTGGLGPVQQFTNLFFRLQWVDIPPDYFVVFWNNNPVYYLGDLQSFPYQTFEIDSLPMDGLSLLSFEFSSNQRSVWWLDDVSVQGNAATPEPGSLVLLGSGVLSLAGVARRYLFTRTTH